MKKIPSLFQREDAEKGKQSLLVNKVTPGCEWAIRGEGRVSKKWDGTAVLILENWPWKRYDAKQGKPAPAGGIPCQEPDPITGHWPHWVKCDPANPADQWILEAFENAKKLRVALLRSDVLPEGTYEAIGPKIGANPEDVPAHMLERHGDAVYGWKPTPGRAFQSVQEFLASIDAEGVIFTHPDGRMCKAKRRDFGLRWPLQEKPTREGMRAAIAKANPAPEVVDEALLDDVRARMDRSKNEPGTPR